MTLKKNIVPLLNSISYRYEDQENGSLKWWIRTPDQQTINIKYIDSPCFDYNFRACKNYGEIRLLPDLTLQSCLINSSGNLKIDFELNEQGSQQRINQLFHTAWKNFTHC